MRILHVTQCDHAGVPRHIAALAAFQAQSGDTVTVAGPPRLRLPPGIDHHPWTARSSPVVRPRELTGLRRIFGSVDPDIVHLHSAKAGLVGRLLVRGTRPTVFTPHGWSFVREGGTSGVARSWEHFAARWTTGVLAVNPDEVTVSQAFGWPNPPVLVPNGIDADQWAPVDAAGQTAARRELGLDPDAPVVLCVGRFVPQKGQLLLAQGWSRVRAASATATLALVGDGPLHPAVRALHAPGVLLPGATDAVATWYAAADLVVQPSRWEGMSYVTLEAMACGLPVLAFDVGGMELALGEGPHLLPPGDLAALADRVVELLASETARREMGERNRERVVAQFDERRLLAAIDRQVHAWSS